MPSPKKPGKRLNIIFVISHLLISKSDIVSSHDSLSLATHERRADGQSLLSRNSVSAEPARERLRVNPTMHDCGKVLAGKAKIQLSCARLPHPMMHLSYVILLLGSLSRINALVTQDLSLESLRPFLHAAVHDVLHNRLEEDLCNASSQMSHEGVEFTSSLLSRRYSRIERERYPRSTVQSATRSGKDVLPASDVAVTTFLRIPCWIHHPS